MTGLGRAGGLALALVVLGGAQAQADQDTGALLPPGTLMRPEAVLGALTGLEVDRQIEEKALVEDLEQLAAWRARRDQALKRLNNLYQELDVSFNTAESKEEQEEVQSVDRRLMDQEALLAVLGQQGRSLRRRIHREKDRLAALSSKADELIALLPSDEDNLTGLWNVRFTPTAEHGIFSLYQTGTILSGEYVLGGGWHGSLEGTVVNGRVFLERIDAEKGRFASMTGLLSENGRSIRGTWKERDLTANRADSGSWTAQKRVRGRTSEP
ncbi:MAG: hypothetical protein ACE5HD_07845 [Acidobacteriota bacterium]